MKRSENVGLMLMGGAAFAATFAAGMAYFAWEKSSHAAAQAQSCTTRPDGTQECRRGARGFAYYLLPGYFSGASGTASTSSGATAPTRTQGAALTGNPRIASPAPASGTVRDGFGSTARKSIRVSAGG